MAVSFVAAGLKTAGTTAVSISWPTSGSAGDYDVVGICGWEPPGISLTAADGTWTTHGQVDGGTGTSIDAHQTSVNAFSKVSPGNVAGSIVFGTAAAAGAVGMMLRYSKGATETWDVVSTSGTDNTHAANRSVTGGAIDLAVGDVVLAIVAIDTDTNLNPTALEITAPGITFGAATRRSPNTNGSGNGRDGNIDVIEATVTAGSGSVAPTIAITTAVTNCGPVRFVRLRASTPPSGATPLPGWGIRI